MKIDSVRRPWENQSTHRHNIRHGDRSSYQTTAWKRLVDLIWSRDKSMCQLCLKEGIQHRLVRGTMDLSIQGTVDHKKRRDEGGSDNPDNLWLIGTNHHNRKDNNAGR